MLVLEKFTTRSVTWVMATLGHRILAYSINPHCRKK